MKMMMTMIVILPVKVKMNKQNMMMKMTTTMTMTMTVATKKTMMMMMVMTMMSELRACRRCPVRQHPTSSNAQGRLPQGNGKTGIRHPDEDRILLMLLVLLPLNKVS